MFSNAIKQSVVTALTGAALASALIVAGASADEGYQDLRSPDAVDAARTAGDPPPVAEYQDLRSPDTRDHAEDYQPTVAPQPAVEAPSSQSGFDLVSAAIGAAAGTGFVIVLLAAGGISRRRPLTRRHGTARA